MILKPGWSRGPALLLIFPLLILSYITFSLTSSHTSNIFVMLNSCHGTQKKLIGTKLFTLTNSHLAREIPWTDPALFQSFILRKQMLNFLCLTLQCNLLCFVPSILWIGQTLKQMPQVKRQTSWVTFGPMSYWGTLVHLLSQDICFPAASLPPV